VDDKAKARVEAAIAGADPKSLVLAGEGFGADLARSLARAYPEQIDKLVQLNPASLSLEVGVPWLLVRAGYDTHFDSGPGGRFNLHQRDLKKIDGKPGQPVFVKGWGFYLPVMGVDRRLRAKSFPRFFTPQEKEAAAHSHETLAKTAEVARAIVDFLEGRPPAQKPAGKKEGPKKPSAKASQRQARATAKALEALGEVEELNGGGELTWLHFTRANKHHEFRRIAGMLEGVEGVAGKMIAVRWEGAWEAVDKALAAAEDKSIVLSGHAEGSTIVEGFAARHPQKIQSTVLFNPDNRVRRAPEMPTLVLRGEYDRGKVLEEEIRSMGDPPAGVTWVPVARGDCSLRFRPPELGRGLDPATKHRLEQSADTAKLRQAVGQVVGAFVAGKKLPAWVEKAVAEVTGTAPAREVVKSKPADPEPKRDHRLPQPVRKMIDRSLAANEAMLRQMDKDRAFDSPYDEMKTERDQKRSDEIAVGKVHDQWGTEPEPHPSPRKPVLIGLPEQRSKRTVLVLRRSQPSVEDLIGTVRAAKGKVRPEQIAVVNLRLENNEQRHWPKKHPELRGVKMIHAGYLDHSVPPLSLVTTVLRTMVDPELKLVVLHCYAGRARTGTMVAAMRIALDGWSAQRALAEAEKHKLGRPIQQHFIRRLGKLAAAGKLDLEAR
jgi:pimeloyl-ACP methyl ester carboxylesterase